MAEEAEGGLLSRAQRSFGAQLTDQGPTHILRLTVVEGGWRQREG